jgi:hypothetical protein
VKEEWVVYLGVLLSSLPTERVLPVLERLHLSNLQKEIVTRGLEISSKYPDLFKPVERRLLEASFKRSEIYEALSGKPDEALAIAASIAVPGAPMRRLIKTYLGELESIRLEVTASDLLALGARQGPKIGQILRLLFEAKLDGRVPDRDAELELARKLTSAT